MNNKFSEIIQNISSVKLPKVVKASSNIPANLKFKCDMCDSSFKKKITLEKHKNTKHSSSNQKIGEGQFGFAFDVIPGKEAEAAELQLEWKEKKNENNTSNKNDDEKSEYSKKSKESEVFNAEDYF